MNTSFGQRFSFSEADKAMNNNNAATVGGEEQSLLAPPDATELVQYTGILLWCNAIIRPVRICESGN